MLVDEEGRTRLVDFGQARALGDRDSSFGTLGYMPPEQARGDAQPDVRWDVYGFGATAYRLLTRLNQQLRQYCAGATTWPPRTGGSIC